MPLKLLVVYTLLTGPVKSEILLSGAIYFDSENTLIEVKDLIKSGDTNGLAMLFKGNHISDKVPHDADIVVLVSGAEPESKTEFRFTTNPTTYWTYARYVKIGSVTPVPASLPSLFTSLWLPPALQTSLPPNLPSSLVSVSSPDPPAAPSRPSMSILTLSPSPAAARQPSHLISAKHHYHHHFYRKKKSPAPETFWQKLKKFFSGNA